MNWLPTASIALIIILLVPARIDAQGPFTINDDQLAVELVTEGLSVPTSMVFIDAQGTILVTQKNDGKVVLVSKDGTIADEPVLDHEVNARNERGLLGIATINEAQIRNLPQEDYAGRDYVFLYLTQAENEEAVGNRVYKYEWDSESQALVNETLILDLPVLPGPQHDGGKLVLDTDGNLYAVIGDLHHNGVLQNNRNGPEPDDTSVIIRTNLSGSPALGNPFSGEKIEYYYAYGIRNSFGLAVDPLTGTLWDSENGPIGYDELNIVQSGFNSGWNVVMGPLSASSSDIDSLVSLPGSQYADPLLSWRQSVAVTGIEFLNSNRLGEKYTFGIFVGDYNGGNLYYFPLNESRDDIMVDQIQGLSDRVIDSDGEKASVQLARFSAGITDVKTGPDGFLYVLTIDGKIYRLTPA